MRNSRKIQLLSATIVGMILLNFIPMVQGCRGHRTIKRSLNDWLYSSGSYMYGAPLNPDIGSWFSNPLMMYPHIDADGNLVPVWDCDYTGFVLDKEMSDGRHMITVHMHVKGVPLVVNATTGNPESPTTTTIFEGEMDYIYIQKFIVNITEWPKWLIGWADDDGFDEYGNILLPVYYIPIVYGPVFGFEFVSIFFLGGGKGTAVNYWNDLEPGDSARVQMGMCGVADEGIVDWKIDYIKVY